MVVPEMWSCDMREDMEEEIRVQLEANRDISDYRQSAMIRMMGKGGVGCWGDSEGHVSLEERGPNAHF